jgi:hypothetical protein
VKYADDLVLLAKEEKVLQDMIDKLIEMLWNGNECAKTKVMRISRQPLPVKIIVDQNNWRMWNFLNIWVAF